MTENGAVGTNDYIRRRKHAPQGKKVKKKQLVLFILYLFYFFEKLIKKCIGLAG